MIEKVKSFFKQIKKKKAPMKRDVVKVVKPKTVTRIISAFFAVMLMFVLFTLIRAITVTNTVKGLTQKITELEQATSHRAMLFSEKQTVDKNRMQAFVAEFLTRYINMPLEEAAQKERLAQLKTYYVPSITVPTDEFQGVSRTIQSMQPLSDTEIDEKNHTLVYEVRYQLLKSILKEREVDQQQGDQWVKVKEQYYEDETLDKVAYISVPVLVEENHFLIAGLPYFVQKPNFAIEAYRAETVQAPNEFQDRTVIASIEKFLPTFLEKYAQGAEDDLKYLMREPVSLQGAFVFQELKDVRYQEVPDDPEAVQVMFRVVFLDKGSEFQHVEYMNLLLKQQDGKWFVEQMKRN